MSIKIILINGITYTEVDKITVNVPDSFVDVQNKLVTPTNFHNPKPSTGETRLYVGSETSINQTRFFPVFSNTINYYRDREALPSGICLFSKDNLLEYLDNTTEEYYNPTQNYFFDLSINYINNRYLIKSLPSDFIPFTLFHHDGQQDRERFYVNSIDNIWSIFRKIVLPRISSVNIFKMAGTNGNLIYLFEAELHEQFIGQSPRSIRNEFRRIMRSGVTRTEKDSIIKSRLGQGQYKSNLLQTMERCPFTQLNERYLLRASHIKPWAKSNDSEKLDGYNGLLLTPTYDVLFDRGIISFENNGELLVSPLLSEDTRICLNLTEGHIYDIANSRGHRSRYLEYHRSSVFKKNPLLHR